MRAADAGQLSFVSAPTSDAVGKLCTQLTNAKALTAFITL